MKKTFTRYVTVYGIVDGDTINGDIDCGDGIFRHNVGVRFDKVDAPESHSENPLEVQAAGVVKSFVASRLRIGNEYSFTSTRKADKYGRAIGDIHDHEGNDMATVLLTMKYAHEYDGGKKKPWTDEELKYIIDSPAATSMGGSIAPAAGVGQRKGDVI